MSVHTPAKTRDYEASVAAEAKRAMGFDTLIQGAIDLHVTILLPIPESESKKRKALMASNAILPTKKPDGDNVLKAIKDAINGIVWRDDSQVVDGHYSKRYSVTPGVRVIVQEIEPSELSTQPALDLQPAPRIAEEHPF